MDIITHAIIGATVARATASTPIKSIHIPMQQRIWLGAMAATFPDIDYLSYLLDPLSFISDWHRSITHSLIMLPLWSVVLGGLFALMCKNKNLWLNASLICGLSLLSHILADLITSWGVQVLAPFSSYSIALGFTFVIDPYFTLLILSGLILSLNRDSRLVARLSLAGLLLYVGCLGILKQQAYEVAYSNISVHPWKGNHIYVMPQPYSPFNWKLIISDAERYHVAHVDLIASDDVSLIRTILSKILTGLEYYRSPANLHWSHYSRYGDAENKEAIFSAWNHPAFERYRRFARYPALSQVVTMENNNCFEFMDLRYTLPRQSTPFKYALCQNLLDQSTSVIQLDSKTIE